LNTYKIVLRLPAETKEKATKEIGFRVPNGTVCSVRKDNGGSK